MIPPTNIFVPFTVFWVYMSRSPDILLQCSTWLMIRLTQLQVTPYQEFCRLYRNLVASYYKTSLRCSLSIVKVKPAQPYEIPQHTFLDLSVPENFVSSTGWPVWLWVFWKSHLGVLSWTMTMMPGKYGVVIIMDSDLHLVSCVPAPKSYKKVWWSMKMVDRLDNVWCWCELV